LTHFSDCSVKSTIFLIKDHSYQVRRYATSLWTSTMVKGYSEENAKKVGFKRLFDYIRGDNDRGIQKNLEKDNLKVDFQCVF